MNNNYNEDFLNDIDDFEDIEAFEDDAGKGFLKEEIEDEFYI